MARGYVTSMLDIAVTPQRAKVDDERAVRAGYQKRSLLRSSQLVWLVCFDVETITEKNSSSGRGIQDRD